MPAKKKQSTRDAYAKRFRQLRQAAEDQLACEQVTDEAVIRWLIEVKRPSLCPASWRQYRAACVWALEQRADGSGNQAIQLRSLIEKLMETRADSVRPTARRTSAQKAKKLPQNDFDKIILTAYADRAADAKALQVCLTSGRLTGLRPIEWRSARLVKSPVEGFKWALIVHCAKHDDLRAHSETRTLFFESLPAHLESSLRTWLGIVGEAVDAGTFEKLCKALPALMRRITRKAFSRRKTFPTLYSARHEAAGRWKYIYIERHSDPAKKLEGAAIVAALLGHASDETATQHYARAHRRGGDFPVPHVDPAEVARVRRRLAENRAKLDDSRESRKKATPK